MPPLLEIAVAVPMLVGTFFMVVTSFGLLRFPDLYCRMHAAGKAGTLGIILVILSTVVHFAPDGPSVPVRGLLAIWFQMLTTPAATHLLARAAYVGRYPRTELTVIDELEVYLGSYVREYYGKE